MKKKHQLVAQRADNFHTPLFPVRSLVCSRCLCVNSGSCDSDARLKRLAGVMFHCRYVNGKTYMEDVASALEEAKEEIFITDWW